MVVDVVDAFGLADALFECGVVAFAHHAERIYASVTGRTAGDFENGGRLLLIDEDRNLPVVERLRQVECGGDVLRCGVAADRQRGERLFVGRPVFEQFAHVGRFDASCDEFPLHVQKILLRGVDAGRFAAGCVEFAQRVVRQPEKRFITAFEKVHFPFRIGVDEGDARADPLCDEVGVVGDVGRRDAHRHAHAAHAHDDQVDVAVALRPDAVAVERRIENIPSVAVAAARHQHALRPVLVEIGRREVDAALHPLGLFEIGQLEDLERTLVFERQVAGQRIAAVRCAENRRNLNQRADAYRVVFQFAVVAQHEDAVGAVDVELLQFFARVALAVEDDEAALLGGRKFGVQLPAQSLRIALREQHDVAAAVLRLGVQFADQSCGRVVGSQQDDMPVEAVADFALSETGDASREDVRNDRDQSSGEEDRAEEGERQQRQAFITQRIAILQHERTGIEQQFEDAHVV